MKRRSDSAFGLHFDFHATPQRCNAVGATLKEEDIREICRLLHPDFIQVDCKGHPGWASYPTECGNAMPKFAMDTLALWRRVTREEGVALYLHYSGVIDHKYCAEHPEDAVMNADGTRSDCSVRTNGSYADTLLIPQIKELAGKYGVDGVWIDGECWGTQADYDPETVAAFEKEYGVLLHGKLPAAPEDSYYNEYLAFCRELFRRYVRYYTDEIHKEYPDFQIASNWAFTDHMPEAVTANVDFLSGDFNPWNSFNVARYAGRAIAQQNCTWDLMAWNFRSALPDKPVGVPKHPVQIMQEAAAVLAVGGGFQNYITQYPDGSPRMEQIRRMKPVADFIREREPYCFRGKAVHEAAILLSTWDRNLEAGMFGRNGYERTVGLVSVFCDAGQSVEITGEHTLRGNCDAYKMIVIPELAKGLAPDMMKEFLTYAENGGSLMLVGSNTCRIFSEFLPAKIENLPDEWQWVSLDHEVIGKMQYTHAIRTEDGENVVWCGTEEKETNIPCGVILNHGKGKVGMLAVDIGLQYWNCTQFMHRDIIRMFSEKLYTPMVKIEKALGMLEIVELCKNDTLYIQLINGNGQHAGTSAATEDFIPPVVDVELSLALDTEPHAIMLQPEGRKLAFTYANGHAAVKLDRVDLHEILEVVM